MLAVLRLTTQQRLLQRPLGPEQALEPGPQHWTLLRLLLEQAGTVGNLTNDAHLAALAIEHNCTLCSADNGFRRFTGLRFTNPLC